MTIFINSLKTVGLLGLLTGLFIVIGGAVGGQIGMIIAFVLAIIMNMGAWWFSDTLALKMSGAQEVSPDEAPELHTMVEELSRRAGIPKPRVYIIDTDAPNAFATGRDPEHGAVAVTTGIARLLTREELAGVIAHELAHIKHRDTLISSIAATIAGAIGMLADMVMWGMIFAGLGGSDEEDGGLAGMVGGVLTAMLAPIMALIIQMAISRSREYMADAGGAQILGNPLPLASALEKLEWAAGRMPMEEARPATAHLYIINPVLGGLASLFRTHPETHKRISRLRAMANRSGNTAIAA
ncbi:zinc metalloprotease HtpX [Chloroflexus sp.]|uniref:zinc metalloprotease HtpX n=1 Tax=Chloroflexus sp. TaxID=1904827 RepID=UPI00261CFA69|nr:zinc metalloprotease HtpX [uncultured Chloroflexus sp.]